METVVIFDIETGEAVEINFDSETGEQIEDAAQEIGGHPG